jgi:hypothetical protein
LQSIAHVGPIANVVKTASVAKINEATTMMID